MWMILINEWLLWGTWNTNRNDQVLAMDIKQSRKIKKGNGDSAVKSANVLWEDKDSIPNTHTIDSPSPIAPRPGDLKTSAALWGH